MEIGELVLGDKTLSIRHGNFLGGMKKASQERLILNIFLCFFLFYFTKTLLG
jgi:hypothetical protein